MKNKKSWKKHNKTCLKRYNVKFSAQSTEIYSKITKKYIYNNIIFDSAPEIAYYIWLTDNNINFIYHPCSFKFKYQSSYHYYHVDFLLVDTNEYIEIKGPRFLSKNNVLLDYQMKSTKFTKAKQKCMNKNNVKIISIDIYKIYMEYCAKKFGNINWYKQFKK